MERNTRQREAIRKVFADEPRPLGPEEVLAHARRAVPRIGLATVYRNLGALRDEGWLVAVNVPQRGLMYQRSGLDHHHHFFCRTCNRLLDFPGCPLERRRLVPRGYVLERHDVLLYGVCRSCARSSQ